MLRTNTQYSMSRTERLKSTNSCPEKNENKFKKIKYKNNTRNTQYSADMGN